MTSPPPPDPHPDDADPARAQLTAVRELLGHATQRLLGDTIALTDEQWRAPSLLPDWSRGHVASHLARNADALGRLAAWALTGDEQPMYASPEARDADIGAGADRSGLDLQVDLDSAAGQLDAAFAALDAEDRWSAMIEARGIAAPARFLPLMRLVEVVLHHIDLDCGFGADDVDPEAALWLLQLVSFRQQGRSDYPPLLLVPDEGDPVPVGPDAEDRITVSGPASALLGFVTRRRDAAGLTGADGLDLPSYG